MSQNQNPIFDITITDNSENNTETTFYGKKYKHTLPKEAIIRIQKIIQDTPAIFKIPKTLEPNNVLDGDEYFFIFSDGQKSNSFSGFNILNYGRKPRKNATLALRTARRIKEEVLLDHHIRTMLPSRLQNWPKPKHQMSKIQI